jgi:hypothetical protein
MPTMKRGTEAFILDVNRNLSQQLCLMLGDLPSRKGALAPSTS